MHVKLLSFYPKHKAVFGLSLPTSMDRIKWTDDSLKVSDNG
jgi:hypothetical protein